MQRRHYLRISLALGFVTLAVALTYEHRRLVQVEKRLAQVEERFAVRRAGTGAPSAIPISGAALEGNQTAAIALVIYSDFQCPYCSGFARTTFRDIERHYVSTGKLLVVFKHFPLQRIHNLALDAAETAACANEQNRFWALHDRIFQGPSPPNPANLATWANELGLDRGKLMQCVQVGNELAQIQMDTAEARSLGFSGTPSFVLGRIEGTSVRVLRRVSGAQPLATFTQVIDEVLTTGGQN